jgi:hypothetical protein
MKRKSIHFIESKRACAGGSQVFKVVERSLGAEDRKSE